MSLVFIKIHNDYYQLAATKSWSIEEYLKEIDAWTTCNMIKRNKDLKLTSSNSLIIQKPKTKEIMHRDVFGYLMKNSSFLHP